MRIILFTAIVWVTNVFLPYLEASDLYNNLEAPIDSSSYLYDTVIKGLSFRTTSTEFVVDQIVLPLMNSGSVSSGSVEFSIFDASGPLKKPGSIVGSIIGAVSVASISTSHYENITFSNISKELSPDTNYWLLINTKAVNQSIDIQASFSNSGTLTGSLGYTFSDNSGSSWSIPSTSAYYIGKIVAVSYVPEPSPFVMAGITSIALFLVRCRNMYGTAKALKKLDLRF
jgi:hypothetical protein